MFEKKCSFDNDRIFPTNFQCGTVWINSWLIRELRMPFGGIKDSGIGREGYPYSEEVFTELKTICLNLA